LSSRRAKTVSLAISLTEAVVKNGGTRVHLAVGTESFMRDMAMVARKYCGKSGSDNIEVAELALDVIQAWGEAFLSRRGQFPAFVKAYHDLRKEGLQFKPQYDMNRVPIFEPVGGGGEAGEDSGILKAAMAASMDSSEEPISRSDFIGRNKKGVSMSADLLESMVTSLGILSEILTACSTSEELKENDLAGEVASQLRELQNGLGAAIEYELTHDPEVLKTRIKGRVNKLVLIRLLEEDVIYHQ
jgi:hypothetical protein